MYPDQASRARDEHSSFGGRVLVGNAHWDLVLMQVRVGLRVDGRNRLLVRVGWDVCDCVVARS